MPVGDPTASEVVGRELHLDLVAGEDADVVLAHLPGDRREDVVTTVELDAEHRARQGLGHLAFDLDLLFLAGQTPPWLLGCTQRTRLAPRKGHGTRTPAAFVSTRGPSAVMATVCSKCAVS